MFGNGFVYISVALVQHKVSKNKSQIENPRGFSKVGNKLAIEYTRCCKQFFILF